MNRRARLNRLTVVALPVIAALVALPLTLGFGKDEAGGKELVRLATFKFKPDATSEQIKAVEEGFAVLKANCPEIATLKWGTITKPENITKGFTHGLLLTFASEADRDKYNSPSPGHKELIQKVGPLIADITVFEFWNKN